MTNNMAKITTENARKATTAYIQNHKGDIVYHDTDSRFIRQMEE